MRGECPILLGDLLISNSKESDATLVLPTIGEITTRHLAGRKYKPSGLCQKVNLLSPHLAIAWTGIKLDASMFMGEIISAGLHTNPSRESIRAIYKELNPQDLSIAGIYRDGKRMELFAFNLDSVTTGDPSLKWFKAGGTGYNSLISILPELHTETSSGEVNKLEMGVSLAIGIVSSLLALEVETALSLQNLFGAGYEIVHPLGKGLAKFSDLTYYFWRVIEEAPQKWLMMLPFLAMKYCYHGDILIIRCVRLTHEQANKARIEGDEIHMVKPLHQIVNDSEIIGYKPTSLNSSMICNIFLCQNSKGDIGAYSRFGRYQSPPVIWRNEFKDDEGVDINTRFMQDMAPKIVSVFETDLAQKIL